jgi:hypothetical protein
VQRPRKPNFQQRQQARLALAIDLMALHAFCAPRHIFPDENLMRAIADLVGASVGISDSPLSHLAEPALEMVEFAHHVIDRIEATIRQVSDGRVRRASVDP